MQMIVKCPKCAAQVSLDANAADRRVRCPRCNRLLKVPKMEDLARATQVLQQAKGTIYVDENGRIYG